MIIKQFIQKIRAEDGLSNNTTVSYESDLRLFINFIDNKSIANICKNDIDNYINYLFKQKVKNSTLSRKISSLKSFFEFLIKENIIKSNPTIKIKCPKKEKRLPKFLTEKQVLELLNAIKDDKSEYGIMLSVIIEILYGSGLRVSELISLKISYIQRDSNNNIKNHLIIAGKGNKERIVPLSKAAISIINQFLLIRKNMNINHSKWLFPGNIRYSKSIEIIKKRDINSKNDKHITRQKINYMLKNLAHKTGIDPDIIYPHILRHSFATHLLNNGINIIYLQKMLGHAIISSTEIYTYIMDNKLKDIIKNYHPLNKGD